MANSALVDAAASAIIQAVTYQSETPSSIADLPSSFPLLPPSKVPASFPYRSSIGKTDSQSKLDVFSKYI